MLSLPVSSLCISGGWWRIYGRGGGGELKGGKGEDYGRSLLIIVAFFDRGSRRGAGNAKRKGRGLPVLVSAASAHPHDLFRAF